VDNVSPDVFEYCQRLLRVSTSRRNGDDEKRREIAEKFKNFTAEEQHQIAEILLKGLKQAKVISNTLQGPAALRLLGIIGQRRRLKAPRAPHLDQDQWDVEDLRALPEWPYSRPMTYKILHQMAAEGKIKLNGLVRGKIDTTKRYKRTYTRFWISRKDKEIVAKEIFGK
jgi:hypothetical protein